MPDIRSKLDAEKYQRLNPVATDRDVNEFLYQHLNDVQLLLDAKTCITYQRFIQVNKLIVFLNIIVFVI